jgi:hypothetical protein
LRYHALNYESVDLQLSALDWDDDEHRLVINWEEDDLNAILEPFEDSGLLDESGGFFESDEKATDLTDVLLRRIWVQTTKEGEEFVNVVMPDGIDDERPELRLEDSFTRFRFRFMFAMRNLDDQALIQTRIHRTFTRPNLSHGQTTGTVNGNSRIHAPILHNFVCLTRWDYRKRVWVFGFRRWSSRCNGKI